MLLHRKSPDLAMNAPLQNGQSLSQETKDGEIERRKTYVTPTKQHLSLSIGLADQEFP